MNDIKERRNMDLQTQTELGYIKTAIERLETSIQKLLDREENRVSRIIEIERDLILHCKDCSGYRAGFANEINIIKTDIEILKNNPEKNKKNWIYWTTLVISLTALIGSVYAGFLILQKILNKLG